jgi:hypothetical protein
MHGSINTLLADSQALGADDRWAMDFFGAMLAHQLSERAFEAAVDTRWRDRDFVIHAPATAEWLHELSTAGKWNEAGYAHAAPELGFRSHYLVGTEGLPGAVFIHAPAEANERADLKELNRPLHQHDSGRMAVITAGKATFHVMADGAMLDCPVAAGDVVFWPKWTPHTFDARGGFSLITAMARYVSPAEDGFVFAVDEDVAALPRRAYSDYRAA